MLMQLLYVLVHVDTGSIFNESLQNTLSLQTEVNKHAREK